MALDTASSKYRGLVSNSDLIISYNIAVKVTDAVSSQEYTSTGTLTLDVVPDCDR